VLYTHIYCTYILAYRRLYYYRTGFARRALWIPHYIVSYYIVYVYGFTTTRRYIVCTRFVYRNKRISYSIALLSGRVQSIRLRRATTAHRADRKTNGFYLSSQSSVDVIFYVPSLYIIYIYKYILCVCFLWGPAV
jgi:hypothetical protein